MPELPEVENYRRYWEASSLNQTIADLEVLDQRLIKCNETELRKLTVGNQFVETKRIGKYLFVKVSVGKWLVVHFAMSGDIEYYQSEIPQPRFAQVIFSFDAGQALAYLSRRKFGWIDIAEDVESYQLQKKLGQDALEISESDFVNALLNRKTKVKPALLEQTHFAGIGNWIADEILHRTKIHPESRLNELNKSQLKSIYQSLMEVLKISVEVNTNYSNFPEGFFALQREKAGKCLHCEAEVIKTVVGGRGTYTCPICQVP